MIFDGETERGISWKGKGEIAHYKLGIRRKRWGEGKVVIIDRSHTM